MRGARQHLYFGAAFFQLLMTMLALAPVAAGQLQGSKPSPQFFSVALLRRVNPSSLAVVPGKYDAKATLLIQGTNGRLTAATPFAISFVDGLAQVPVPEGTSALFLEGAPADTVFGVEAKAVPAGKLLVALGAPPLKRSFGAKNGVQFDLVTSESNSSQALLLVGPGLSADSSGVATRLGAALVADLPGLYANLVQRVGFALGGAERLAENAFTVFLNMSGGAGSGSLIGGGGGSAGGDSGGIIRPGPGGSTLQCPPNPGSGQGGGMTGGEPDPRAIPIPLCPNGVTRVFLPGGCEFCQALGPQICTICEGPKACSTSANCRVTDFNLCVIKLGGGACLTS